MISRNILLRIGPLRVHGAARAHIRRNGVGCDNQKGNKQAEEGSLQRGNLLFHRNKRDSGKAKLEEEAWIRGAEPEKFEKKRHER
jgi:hypothetical protein